MSDVEALIAEANSRLDDDEGLSFLTADVIEKLISALEKEHEALLASRSLQEGMADLLGEAQGERDEWKRKYEGEGHSLCCEVFDSIREILGDEFNATYVDDGVQTLRNALGHERARADRLAAVAEERLRLLRGIPTGFPMCNGGIFVLPPIYDEIERHIRSADSVWAFGDVELKAVEK